MIDGYFFNGGIGIGLVSGTWRGDVDGRCSTAGNVDGGSPVTVPRTVVIETPTSLKSNPIAVEDDVNKPEIEEI